MSDRIPTKGVRVERYGDPAALLRGLKELRHQGLTPRGLLFLALSLGSIYAARPIGLEDLMWRVDMLESVDGPVGSFDRTHHHPRCTDWEPDRRVFDPELSADPIGWFADRLHNIESVLDDAHIDRSVLGPHDADDIRASAPTSRVPWPSPVRSSAIRMSPGPSRRTLPSPISMSTAPLKVKTA